MDAFITFYHLKNKVLSLSNGFSFGRENMGAEMDFFFEQKTPVENMIAKIKESGQSFERFFCSVTYNVEFKTIQPLIKNNWIVGGPAVVDALESQKFFEGKLEKGTLEKYNQEKKLSSKFDPYFENFIKEMMNKENIDAVQYFCSIGKGCYWNKCKFCHYDHYATHYVRPDITKIVSSLSAYGKKTFVHLGIETPTPKILKDVIKAKTDKNLTLILPIRADAPLIKVLKEAKSLKGIVFSIGLENLSQTGREILGKGMTTENILDFIDIVLKKNGVVCLYLMDLHAFMDKKMLSEGLDFLSRLKEIYDEHQKRRKSSDTNQVFCSESLSLVSVGDLYFENNGVTCWSTKKQAPVAPYGFVRTGFSKYNQFNARVPRNSKEFNYNKLLSQAIINSEIKCIGKKMAALHPDLYSAVTRKQSFFRKYFKYSRIN
ncbi:hypothetical protein ISS04_04330 [Candidatus Woesearchaeota archaeon]|nr:hypothetical protein [Candidatus Woesearchaeota archaeon]